MKTNKKQRFYTLDYFEIESDAQLVKAKLESEGIAAFIREENRNYSGVLSNGIMLQVYESDKDLARSIYDQIRPYALDSEGNPIICPNCKASRSEIYYSRKGLLYKLFPFLEPRKYRCLNCQMITRK